MGSRVQALSVTHVPPAAQVTDPPPRHGNDDHAIKLSLFDLLFIALTPIQRLFFYEGDDLPPFPTLSSALQSSLAATLAVFTPLAGTLGVSSEGDVVIDCSPDAVSTGIRFTEAEYGGGADAMRRFAADAEHDAEAFVQLVPTLQVSALPAPVLAVQVTRPAEGQGVVAVGVSVNHAVADGQALWQFMRAWAAAARDGSPAVTGLPTPTFDRAAINRHPKVEEMARVLLHIFAPALPKVNTFPEPALAIQRTRTYRLGADQIRSLKQRIWLQCEGGADAGVKAPTTYAAVASLVWTSIVRASNHRDEDDTYLMFAADCRGRLRPPLPASFFGNCVKLCYARAAAGELRAGAGGLARGAAAVREAVREYLEDPLGDAERWLQRHEAVAGKIVAQMGSSQRFAGYETDFGWGAPCRVELGSVFVRQYVALLGAPDGAVQVSVALDRDRIDGFQATFLSLLHASA